MKYPRTRVRCDSREAWYSKFVRFVILRLIILLNFFFSFFFELREHTIISIVEINWNIDDSNLHIHLDFSTRLTRLLLINELRGAFAHRSVSNDLGGARSSILFFFLFGTDRSARLAAMTRATFLSSRGEAGEHHLIVLIRAISSARERLSSGLRVTITVPTGSKWWIEHAGVTTPPLKRAPSRKVEGAIIDGVFFIFLHRFIITN